MRAWCGPGAGPLRTNCGPIAGQLRANCGPSAGQVRAQCGPGAEDRILQLKFGNPCLTWNSIDRRNRSNWSNSTCQFLTPAMFPFRIGQTHGRKTRPCRVSVSNRSEARPRISDMLCLSETGSALALGPPKKDCQKCQSARRANLEHFFCLFVKSISPFVFSFVCPTSAWKNHVRLGETTTSAGVKAL